MREHRYSAPYVSVVREDQAREQLQSVGLPEVALVFTPHEPASGTADLVDVLGRDLLRIGFEEEPGSDFFVDPAKGEIVFARMPARESYFVNSSPAAFRECLALLDAAVKELTGPYDLDPFLERTEQLRASIRAVDPLAVSDDDGYWQSLLFDVSNGDYATE
ncbi:hypothetical protein FB565_007438 [Actinoplanes lutulentus]|uniref:SUKH-4 immunity protein of toxin-antitoxin system n=1 Tax=Actinoplanes lutulentus TaxID=1287878 RepID=A0A327Z4Z4_9ACTN|nr:SUKH-4 family immunity protein [Actinoplanes lutulentus]MBB2947667.1 hypothetical protein [Actinoplanes lutulentus]RAK27723.1 SUKH-4 immunity protein of toxin-antitoxin system [Actinoplanes lutulentus]